MGTFKFRLEKVWKHRRQVVDEHSVAVARINRKVAALSREIEDLETNIARQAGTMVRTKGDNLLPGDLISGATWLAHLHHLRTELGTSLQNVVNDLEDSRSRLTESWRDLEVLSRLRDRQAENWRTSQDTRDRKEMDEIGQFRAFRHSATKDSL
jgi:flagellar export protein FliJ